MMNEAKCWEAVQGRDASKDGQFLYGVLTTGVYCRPSCRSRLPLRKNVRFYDSPLGAERDGLRACLRCRPLARGSMDTHVERTRRVCRYIETHVGDSLNLQGLARLAGLNRFHFLRSFRAIVGVTPKQYVAACRLKALKNGLRKSKDVTEAVYEAGYGSSSRVYERSNTRLGMTPKQYRQGGQDTTITHVSVQSPIGLMMIGATERGICFVQFGETSQELLTALREEYPAAQIQPMRDPKDSNLQGWIEALMNHLDGKSAHLFLPLDIRATAFQMHIWNYLQSIPLGETRSYGDVAKAIGRPTAVRAVARACAANRAAIAIPCHRVIRGSGEPGGYCWGLPRKRVLLDRERVARAHF